MAEFLVASALILFLASNAFWLYHYNKLLNKFMSRNYHDYVAAEGIKKEFEEPRIKFEDPPDSYEAQRARELNQMTGMA